MKNQGFSLLDLVIAMAIMGILASIAVPSFNQNVRKARRSDALQTLLEISQQQERFFFRNNRYSCDLQAAGELNRGTTQSLEGHYTISMTPVVASPCPNATTYTITAVAAVGDDQGEDTTCNSMSLSSTGLKSAQDVGANDTTTKCWGD